MKRFFLLSVVLVALASCVPLSFLEEKHEFIVEVVGDKYLNDVKDWYQTSYSDYWVQEHPVVVLYYDGSGPYSERQEFYSKEKDFVAAGGEIVDTNNLKNNLNKTWSSYTPIYDVDVWWQVDADEWQARVRSLSRLELVDNKVFLMEFKKSDEYFLVQSITEPSHDSEKDVYHLGRLKRDSIHGFAVFVQEVPSKITLVSNTKILGAEVVWPE
ncbi:hypothetical protein [Thermotoga sp.]|uniref:hypothetical protein n=1 Tax=Thermotoga sp. TaxID=28240 RepID=UPI0025E02729|nr:hypothetical protein [Thermotoga sp.]MCD6551630.1 hypothetical protein [Thermotoga sp.]